MAKAGLSPFGQIVDRALRESLHGVHFSEYVVRCISRRIREDLTAYVKSHGVLTIKGFGTFERKFETVRYVSGRTSCKPRLTFTPVNAVNDGAVDESGLD
jgi:hypothetical protein